jgi:transposase
VGWAWKDVAVPKPYPSEFRDDVVRVAQNREPGVTIEQIAKDFGVHPMTLQKWMRRADIDSGAKPGQSRTESAELREARKRILAVSVVKRLGPWPDPTVGPEIRTRTGG